MPRFKRCSETFLHRARNCSTLSCSSHQWRIDHRSAVSMCLWRSATGMVHGAGRCFAPASPNHTIPHAFITSPIDPVTLHMSLTVAPPPPIVRCIKSEYSTPADPEAPGKDHAHVLSLAVLVFAVNSATSPQRRSPAAKAGPSTRTRSQACWNSSQLGSTMNIPSKIGVFRLARNTHEAEALASSRAAAAVASTVSGTSTWCTQSVSRGVQCSVKYSYRRTGPEKKANCTACVGPCLPCHPSFWKNTSDD